MSNINGEKVDALKKLLKDIHSGADPRELRVKFKDLLTKVSPFEIPLIEQQLVREGIPVSDILGLCDLHVELFREALMSRELRDVPRGHPIDLLLRENNWILKQAEALGIYGQAIVNSDSIEKAEQYIKVISSILVELKKKIILHYRKIQMLIFPYLERMGITAVPRVLWGREDRVKVKIRELITELQKHREKPTLEGIREIGNRILELSREVSELVFRENKILYPAVHTLLPEGVWRVISEIGDKMGYIVDVGERDWKTNAEPIYPYEFELTITPELIEKLPEEFRSVALATLQVDSYRLKREGDLELETGFLTLQELEGIFRALPLEITFADTNDRIRFYSESDIAGGFIRTKTILGRRMPFCHPPRLENYVMLNVNALKKGDFPYREFWTKQGDRIIRVIISPVKDREGKLLGVIEVVEDLTHVIEKPDEIKKKIMVL